MITNQQSTTIQQSKIDNHQFFPAFNNTTSFVTVARAIARHLPSRDHAKFTIWRGRRVRDLSRLASRDRRWASGTMASSCLEQL
jgi:hypothetical protein